MKTEPDRLVALRDDINRINREIVLLLERRFEYVSQIAACKRLNALPIEDIKREDSILSSCAATSYPAEIAACMNRIIDEAKKLQYHEYNLYLTGMPGCGKSNIGRKLASILNRPLIDTDQLIMNKAGMSINEIFDRYGEATFRRLEHEVVCEAATRGSSIVATGGGVLTYSPNIQILRHSGKTVFIDRSLKTLTRVSARNRPLIRAGAKAVIRLYNARIAGYRTNSDLIFKPETDELEKIIQFFNDEIMNPQGPRL